MPHRYGYASLRSIAEAVELNVKESQSEGGITFDEYCYRGYRYNGPQALILLYGNTADTCGALAIGNAAAS